MTTTIQIDQELKSKLDSLKAHHRESYNELISRLVGVSLPTNFDRESLLETIEVLSDPDTMKNIAESLRRISEEDFGIPIEEIEKELGFKYV